MKISEKFGDLWAMFWHHHWYLRAGLKFESSHLFKKIKCVPEAPESYLKLFGPIIKFIVLFSCQVMHLFIFPKNYCFNCSPDSFLTVSRHYYLDRTSLDQTRLEQTRRESSVGVMSTIVLSQPVFELSTYAPVRKKTYGSFYFVC